MLDQLENLSGATLFSAGCPWSIWKGAIRESLMATILKGGLEAALDEQLALLRVLGDKQGHELVNELVNGLTR